MKLSGVEASMWKKAVFPIPFLAYLSFHKYSSLSLQILPHPSAKCFHGFVSAERATSIEIVGDRLN